MFAIHVAVIYQALQGKANILFQFPCRSHAIACVNQFIVTRTQALMVHIGSFIEVGLSQFYIEYSFTNIHVWSCNNYLP